MLAQNPELFLGEDLLAWLLLAFGAALVVGNVAALLRPPAHMRDGSTSDGKPGLRGPNGRSGAERKGLRGPNGRSEAATGRTSEADRPPLGRGIAMIIVGLVAAIWGLASLLGG